MIEKIESFKEYSPFTKPHNLMIRFKPNLRANMEREIKAQELTNLLSAALHSRF